MKHAIDALPKGHEWLIFGKGPSFDANASVHGAKKMCINHTANLVKCDVAIMNDLPVLKDMHDFALENTRLFILPSGIARAGVGSPDKTSFWFDNARTLFLIRTRAAFFDARYTTHAYFPTYPVIQSYNSTFETAVWLLGYAGVKKIYTSGIDHTTDYHPSFGIRSDGRVGSNANVPNLVRVATEKFGIEIVAL